MEGVQVEAVCPMFRLTDEVSEILPSHSLFVLLRRGQEVPILQGGNEGFALAVCSVRVEEVCVGVTLRQLVDPGAHALNCLV